MDSPIWIKNKRTITNLTNKKDSKWFQYAITVALNHEEIGGHTKGIAKIKPFIDKYYWEAINYLSENDDWKKFKKNNLVIALNVLMLKTSKYTLPTFQNTTQIVKKKS